MQALAKQKKQLKQTLHKLPLMDITQLVYDSAEHYLTYHVRLNEFRVLKVMSNPAFWGWWQREVILLLSKKPRGIKPADWLEEKTPLLEFKTVFKQ